MSTQPAPERNGISPISRRQFVQAIGAASVAGGALPRAVADQTSVGPKRTDAAESAVARLYKSMNDEQRKLLCFGFDHPLRTKIGANWAITKPKIEDMKPEHISNRTMFKENLRIHLKRFVQKELSSKPVIVTTIVEV